MLMENLPIPQDLQAEFESMATLVYGEEDASRALTEAGFNGLWSKIKAD